MRITPLIIFLFTSTTSVCQEATLEETKAWLKQKINIEGWCNNVVKVSYNSSEFVYTFKVKIDFDGSNVIVSKIDESSIVDSYNTTIKIELLSMDIFSDRSWEGATVLGSQVFVHFNSTKEGAFLTHGLRELKEKSEQREIHYSANYMIITVHDQEKSERLIKAFKHLISLSGGKKEKF